ncbi:MAG: hypothetical protein Q9222_005725 [Ikaeria aurantiellina]
MDERPQSTWSDSDHSDDEPTSWVSKGSKILRKQNSKLNLSSTRSIKEEYVPSWRSQNKHDVSMKPAISKPYNFQHLTHTQACQFPELHHASERQIRTDFSTARASQVPQRELQGIRAEDLTTTSMYDDPVTPPSFSPTKSRASRPGSVLSIRNTGTLSRSHSIDNFSQPSPRTYRIPPSPISPPPRTSSHTAAPDFFSDHHHATPEERALLALGDNEIAESIRSNSLPEASSEHDFDDIVPHAITTPDDIACTLVPPLPRRSTLALADVPEEDELRSIRKTSFETPRPMTAESTLRHAQSFPATACSPHRRNASTSRKTMGRPDSVPFAGPLFKESTAMEHEHCHDMQRTSFGHKMIDSNWEDVIDYSYKLEAEADCEFDWDRVSAMNDPQQTHRESDDSLQRGYENLSASQPTINASNHAPRLQNSLPDLDFSATSSTKSSMASLRGPITPHALPSPRHSKPLQSSKSMDTLNLDSFYIVQDTETPDDPWDHASHFNYPFNNLNIASSKNTMSRSSRPSLNTHHSSESIIPSHATSAVHTRRNTSSSAGLPEMAGGEKKCRQHVDITTEEIASRVSALSMANPSPSARNGPSNHDPPQSILKKSSSDLSGCTSPPSEKPEVSMARQSLKSQDPAASVGSFAHRLRTNSVASSGSGSSSLRTSRISYSLFPSVPSTKSAAY